MRETTKERRAVMDIDRAVTGGKWAKARPAAAAETLPGTLMAMARETQRKHRILFSPDPAPSQGLLARSWRALTSWL